jgi:dienelactone hydrolase
MTDVIVFHHALGLTEGVHDFAAQLRAAGHQVTVPDLYEGATFGTVEEGVAHAQEIGFDTIADRGRAAAESLPAALVYAGFSLGVMPAQMLAQTRPGAKGALLCYACLPPSEFGGSWPAGVPVQIHGMDGDEWFVGDGDIDAARDLVKTAEDAELFLYPGDTHLFADSSLPDYNEAAATLLRQRTLAFLTTVG